MRKTKIALRTETTGSIWFKLKQRYAVASKWCIDAGRHAGVAKLDQDP